MQKEEHTLQNPNEQMQQIGQVQLNQYGRPKQRVIFYELTQQMKHEAKQQLIKDQINDSPDMYKNAKENTQKVWDKFYQYHKCNFFKDRTYLQRQIQPITLFKNLYNQNKVVSQFVELGCGVGNTLFPLLRYYPCFQYYGFDISKKAIQLIQEEMQNHPEYKQKMNVTVCDLSINQIPYKGHGDLNTLIFVLSAIVPQNHQMVMNKIYQWMKPGAFFYFRDYGRYDFGQLNLSSKGNRKLKDNFYMKNDGVCVYYFQKEQLEGLCEKAGLIKLKTHLLCKLLQNRKRNLKMYRVWLQGLFYKPPLQEWKLQQIKKLLETSQTQQMNKEYKELQQQKETKQILQNTNQTKIQTNQEQNKSENSQSKQN